MKFSLSICYMSFSHHWIDNQLQMVYSGLQHISIFTYIFRDFNLPNFAEKCSRIIHIRMSSIWIHIQNEIANFEAILLQELLLLKKITVVAKKCCFSYTTERD